MHVMLFDTRSYDRQAFEAAAQRHPHQLSFVDTRLNARTARLAHDCPAVCAFVNDDLSRPTLAALHEGGTRLVALRSAGFNHADLAAAAELGLKVVRVPEYSPHAVAEHAVALLLTLNRKTHRAWNRVREGNFSLEGLVGFDLYRKTVGLVGTGKIGAAAARLFLGFGCRVLAFDLNPDPALVAAGVGYVSAEQLYRESDVISLHVPLTPATRHLIDDAALATMKRGVVLINTGRGALIDTRALVDALKREHLGGAGLDVYEEEEGIFFNDLSSRVLQDDVLARLLTFPNVLITSHQGFLTTEALGAIAETTLASVTAFEQQQQLVNEVRVAG